MNDSEGVHPLLTSVDIAELDRHLHTTDQLLESSYPGDDGSRQPIHTVYVPADRYSPALPQQWGATALEAVEAQGGMTAVVRALGVSEAMVDDVARQVDDKLRREPIEDLRLDFEDGYGDRGDRIEDADVVRAAQQVQKAVRDGVAPPYIGIRFKCFEAPTRRRGLRSLDLFLGALLSEGELPPGLTLTLPKVTTVAQVEVMAHVCSRIEQHYGLRTGRIRFEVQVETPQLILGPDGISPLPAAIHAAGGRVSALHYGTYDYSASVGVSPNFQTMEHPAADYAKEVMQVAAAQTGVRLSDGSTNILPVGDDDAVRASWALSARLTRRSLERGFYQGWDLHPGQLVPRFVANTVFYREGLRAATTRLFNYVNSIESAVMDEPATARALAAFVLRGVSCGAVSETEVANSIGLDLSSLTLLAHPKLSHVSTTTTEHS